MGDRSAEVRDDFVQFERGAMKIYLDYNATAPVRPEVRDAMTPILFGAPAEGSFGNASSVHWAGQRARKELEAARGSIARRMNRKASEIIFTSGGTEADNLALFGVMLHGSVKAKRLIVSAVEHPAVMSAAARLEELGVGVVRVPVDRGGVLDLDALDRALAEPAALVSVMAVNNETGVVSPVEEVIARAHARGARVHVDAVQAAGRIELPLDADLISLSGHKLGAPKGIGVLAARESLPLVSEIVGGPQERGHRAGTEPVALAVGMATALELAMDQREAEAARLSALVRRIDGCLRSLPGVELVGAPHRVANTTTAIFRGVEGDALLMALDLAGVAASSGSACSSGSLSPSHVLLAMGYGGAEALASVRFSLGWATTDSDIDRLLSVLPGVLEGVRSV
jgi:cysteine desulfurase